MPRKKKNIDPVEFVPIQEVFKPQVEVRATRDINGWVDRGKSSGKKIKWSIKSGDIGYLDIDTARQFEVKGYVEITHGKDLIPPVSDDERAEILSTMTVIGVSN